jgi:hypothetical protein
VTAAANTKPYDGSTSAAATPTITLGSLASPDTPGFSETYDNRNAGMGKTMTPAGSVADGNSGNNYTVTFVTSANGTINALPITVTGAANEKPYDGNTTAAATPTITLGSLVAPDTAGFTETYDNRNAGMGKTMKPAGSVSDGNSGNNYTVTFVNSANGIVDARAISVTASANEKTYDGNTSAAALPAITSGSLVAPDTANFIETYDNRNAGIGKTMTPAGSVTDGNSGNNYAVTFVTSTNGTIDKAPAIVTLTDLNKTYNGNPQSPTVTTNPPLLGVTLAGAPDTNAGNYPMTATINDTNYQGSANAPFVINAANQIVTFGALPDKTFGDPDFPVSAIASSGFAVSFTASGNCTVTPDGTVVHLTSSGSCTITAHQPGGGNFFAAPDVPQTFNIAQPIINGGFETGDLTGWNIESGSVANVRTTLGPAGDNTPLLPVQGNYMAFLSTAGTFQMPAGTPGTTGSRMSQTFTAPSVPSQLRFCYQYVSNDSHQFENFFLAQLDTGAGTFFVGSADNAGGSPAGGIEPPPPPFISDGVTLTPPSAPIFSSGVNILGGDLYLMDSSLMANRVCSSFAIPAPVQGTPVTLRFTTGNVLDEAIESAVVLDDVKVVPQ